MERANVAVARVSCILRGSAAAGGATGFLCWARVSRIFSAEIAIKHEKNRVSEHPQIRAPVETLARGLKIFTQYGISHAMRASVPRRIQRASPIPPRQRGEESAEMEAQQLRQAMAELVVAWKCRCGSSFVHVYAQMCPRLEPQQHLQARGGGSVGNVAVARVWRTSETRHVIKHEER